MLAVVDEAAGLDFDGEELLLREGQVERGFGPQTNHRGLAGADGLQDGSGDAGEIHGFHAGHDGVIHAGGHLGVHDHLGEVITRGRGGGGAAIDDDFHISRRDRGEREATLGIGEDGLVFQADEVDLHMGDGEQVEVVGGHGQAIGAGLRIVGGVGQQVGAGIDDAAGEGGGGHRGDADGAEVEGELAAGGAVVRGIEPIVGALELDRGAIDGDLHLRGAGHRCGEEEPGEAAIVGGDDVRRELLAGEGGVEVIPIPY